MLLTENVFDPSHRFVETHSLRAAYVTYGETRSPGAPNFVTLQDGLELGIVSTEDPAIALAISSLLMRSLEQARCELGGHLPTVVVRRVQQEIISPKKVATLWGVDGHRFVLSRRHDARRREIIATILVALSKDGIFFFTGRYNNMRYSTIVEKVDWDQPNEDDPAQKWFDRFAFPPLQQFKPDLYHQIANFVVSPDCRGENIAGPFLQSIVRYYSRYVIDAHGLPIVHSQHLLCGRGFWQIGDPPWMARMKKLGFYRRWGAESFFVERDWAPLPPLVMGGRLIDNVSYNRMYNMPGCYDEGQVPHPPDTRLVDGTRVIEAPHLVSGMHLLGRVPEVVRLAQDPMYKLQYYQAMLDFLAAFDLLPNAQAAGERS